MLSDEGNSRNLGEKTKKITFQKIEILKFQFSTEHSLTFPHLIAKTASPGPIISVPTLGSWEYDDFKWKMRKTLRGVNYFPCTL